MDDRIKKFLEESRAAQAARSPEEIAEQEAEHAFELRAAFGPGVEVVNVITGRRTVT
jgi:hypothetical protein